MSVKYRTFIRLLLIVSITLVTVSINRPADAAASSIVVTAVWRPGTQLSTIDKNGNGKTNPADGDDLRYVDLELDITTTDVQFLATELTCTVNKTALENYVTNSDPNATDDDIPVVNWSSVWKGGAENLQPFNPATGAMTITHVASRVNPVGAIGKTLSFPLATIRYRVKAVTAATTSSVTCAGSFLDTNGKPVIAPSFVMPTPLKIIPGYTISGNVSYQSRAVKSGIHITCSGVTSAFDATTDANGNFVINTRLQDTFECSYYGNTTTHPVFAPDLYLHSRTTLTLSTMSYKLLPVVLPGGNVDRTTAGSERGIGLEDIALVTGNYNMSARGDINGDDKTDKSDLAIVVANRGIDEVYEVSHVLYGMTRGSDNGSRIWVSDVFSRKLTQLIPGTNVDNWPAISPDGSKLVVTRRLGTAPNYRYALFIMNSDGTGTATQLTPIVGPNGNYDAFAASWSPDGSHLAFTCAFPAKEFPFPSGWLVDDSSLCIIDVAGHGFQVLDTHVHIYPPAWLFNNLLLYAGNSQHNVGCAATGRLCEKFLDEFYNPGQSRVLDVRNTGTIDMPSVSDGALFYRHYDGTHYQYFRADLTSDGDVAIPFSASTSDPRHINLELARTDGDYLTVRPGSRDYLEGGYFVTTNPRRGTAYVSRLLQNGSYSGIFASGLPTVGDPDWNGVPESASNIYALRTTFAWIP